MPLSLSSSMWTRQRTVSFACGARCNRRPVTNSNGWSSLSFGTTKAHRKRAWSSRISRRRSSSSFCRPSPGRSNPTRSETTWPRTSRLPRRLDRPLLHHLPGVRDHEGPDRQHEQARQPWAAERDGRGVVRAVGQSRGQEGQRQPESARDLALLDEQRIPRPEPPQRREDRVRQRGRRRAHQLGRPVHLDRVQGVLERGEADGHRRGVDEPVDRLVEPPRPEEHGPCDRELHALFERTDDAEEVRELRRRSAPGAGLSDLAEHLIRAGRERRGGAAQDESQKQQPAGLLPERILEVEVLEPQDRPAEDRSGRAEQDEGPFAHARILRGEVSRYNRRMRGHRVFVSGIGAVTPYGLGSAALREGLLAGRSAVAAIRGFDPSRFPARIGGEIPPLDLARHFDERELPWLSALAAHAVIAARDAVAEAGLEAVDRGSRGAVIFGTGFGSLAEAGPHYVNWAKIGDAAARPTTIPVLMLNAPAAQIALQLRVTGPSLTLATACSSGSNAIGLAYREIREGRQDVVLAGGGEHALTELMLLSWSRLRVLSRRNNEPERASRPFDADRDGLVLADAVVLLALESEEHLTRRGGTALAEIVGYGSNCGAEHLTAPDRASEVAAMRSALYDADLAAGAVDLVVVHGTATRRNDVVESEALDAVFGDGETVPALTAVKS